MKNSEKIHVKGMFRLHIIENKNGKDEVVGDSGWCKNTVTNAGFSNFICAAIGAVAGSSQASYLALGLGTAPGVTDTGLQSELTDASGCRFSVSPSVQSSKSLRLTGSLASNIIVANRTISNIGIFAVSTTAVGTILAGNTYASSQLQTNQSVNCTYTLGFS